MDGVAALEKVIRRDRRLVGLSLVVVTAFAWVYLIREAASMDAMAVEMRKHLAMGMGDMRAWGFADWLGLFVMWAVMMVAMMLPAATPVIVLVLGVYRRRDHPHARLAAHVFVGGYLLVWTTFSAMAALAQVMLHRVTLMSPDMRFGPAALSAAVLIAAGVYQWLPIKNRCLTHCRSPIGFLSHSWREGTGGALAMGIHHGLFCVGCCWLLMALLFVVGVMNLLWVALLSAFVFIEKLTPKGEWVGRLAGAAVIVWGIYLLVRT
jgi:predicted metal-binding membrane protein